jgi:aspartyl protease family protein
MAIGFNTGFKVDSISNSRTIKRCAMKTDLHFNWRYVLVCAITGFIAQANAATSVTVVGLFPGKAVVVINGQAPRTLSVGDKTSDGVTLVATTSDTATMEIDGKRHKLDVGQHYAAPASASKGQGVTLGANSQGHFITLGQINGRTVQFLVDTGATSVSIPSSIAESAGIDYRKGQRGFTQTANGVAAAYKVVFDSVTVGDVTLYQVDGIVMEGKGMDVALLGMSFLNRMEMKRDGAQMTLVKRF